MVTRESLERDGSILDELKSTYFEVARAFAKYVGSSQSRLDLLALINDRQDVSQADLHKRLQVNGAAVTRIVKQLESEGLVTRRADARDNRITLVTLTEAGREQVSRLLEKRDDFEKNVTDGLVSAERELLTKCLARMRRNVGRPNR